ncbi:hypothetical protein ACTFIR_011959 [Dictyostelium discoideum]
MIENSENSDNKLIGGDDVAVIGIGLRFPSGNLNESISKPNQLFNELLNGLDGIVTTSERWSDNYYLNGEIVSKFAGLLPLDEWKQFDPIFFAINPTYDNVVSIDPQQRLLLKCIWEALEDSGIDPISLRGTNTSTFIGSSTVDYSILQRSPSETQNNIFGSTANSISNRIGYCFDFRGESLTMDTACSSSANAINCGYNSIKSNKSNVSIVGGVNFILDPHISKSFTQLGILSPTGKCHTFSSDADGYVRSEGVGSSSNIDGNFDKLNFYSPSKSSQYENIKLAIKSTNGQINESDIDYCETHGTGTLTGDPIELEVGSIKSNIGHTEACSGVASLIKCCLMFKNKLFLQNINFKEPNPSINFKEWGLKVVTEPIKFNENKPTVMLINNFGITGSNVSLILSEFCGDQFGYSKSNGYQKMEAENKVNEKKKYLIPLSSNSSTSLNNYKLSVIKNSNSNSTSSSTSFEEFVYNQIKFKSTSLIQKSVIIASDWNEFQDENNQIKLENSDNLVSNITVENKRSPITVMVLSGQGSQYNKMALSLYDNEPIFRESVNRLDKELFKYYGYSVLDKLRSIDDNDLVSIHQPILAQPANVIIQVSLYELYKHWGVSADIIIGHSLGEISSAYCSDMIDFQTLCYLTYHRSVAQNRTIFCSILGLSSFHTSSQQMIKDEICSLNIPSKQPLIAVFSTVTTNLFNHQSSPFDVNYAFDNIRQPVRFTQTITNLYKHIESNDMGNEITFIEHLMNLLKMKLNESIIPRPYSIKNILNNNNSKSIFLTGSTGYLGAYLLTELIKMSNISKIYCLIRNNSKLTNPIDEIINNLKKHQLININKESPISNDKLNSNLNSDNNSNNINNNQINENQLIKIIPMIGDISKDKFGLTEQDYLKLSNECDIIINSAADLNFKSNYEESKTVNVNSVNQIIKLSVSNNSSQKLIVHFSSLAVFINHPFMDGEDFEETNLIPSFNSTHIGYIQYKVVSEKLLINAAESRGIPSIIIRPPDIFSNPITGIGHSNDALSLFIKASKEIVYYPNIDKPIFTTPVTTLAKTTIDLIFNENSWNQNKSEPISIYNLNGNPIELRLFYRVLENSFKCKEIQFDEWIELVTKSNGKSSKRYSTFHILNNQSLFSKTFKISSPLKMSNSTKELLISIGSYNHHGWEINESIILNNINNNNN